MRRAVNARPAQATCASRRARRRSVPAWRCSRSARSWSSISRCSSASVEGNLAAGVLLGDAAAGGGAGDRAAVRRRPRGGRLRGLPAGAGGPHRAAGGEGASLFLFLVALEIVAVPAFLVMLLGPAPPREFWRLLLALAARRCGHRLRRDARRRAGGPVARARPARAAAGPAAARAAADRGREDQRAAASSAARGLPARWPWVLALYDLVFGLVAYAVFDFLLED